MRYEKQTNFKEIGHDGQEHLAKSKVLVIGCGALGTMVANNLVRAGIGYIRIVDRDYVELHNLQRQLLFDEDDVQRNLPKAIAAKEKLSKINSSIDIETIVKDVNSTTIYDLIQGIDLIMDCTDNFQTRYLINDVSYKFEIPWIYGGVIGATGVLQVFLPGETPCLRCMMDAPPPSGAVPTCDTAGVLNTVTGVIGSLESNEAIKYLTKAKDKLHRKMLYLDLWENTLEKIEIPLNPECPCCQGQEYHFYENKEDHAAFLCGINSVQVSSPTEEKISLEALEKRLQPTNYRTKRTPYLLKIYAEPYEITLFPDGRALIKNAKTLEEGKTVYARIIGN